jgi:hypothetical protein
MNDDEADAADEYWTAMRSPTTWNEHVQRHESEFIGLSEFDGKLLAASMNWDVRAISLTEPG